MNRRPSGSRVAKALTGFLQYKSTEGDTDVEAVRPQHILSYPSCLRTDCVPRRIAGDNS